MVSEHVIQYAFFKALHQSAPGASKTTHPTAHPRMYFWYLKVCFLLKGDSEGRKLRGREVTGSNPVAPTNLFYTLQAAEQGNKMSNLSG